VQAAVVDGVDDGFLELFNFCGCGHFITLSAIGEPEYSGRG
jgi:hypothetical protein